MSKKDVVWQKLLDAEKMRLISLPVEELLSMDAFTPEVVRDSGITLEYGIWHEVQSKDVEYSSPGEACSLSTELDRNFGIRVPQHETHSFVLKASRVLALGVYRTYLAGFSLDEGRNIIPVSDEILYSYD